MHFADELKDPAEFDLPKAEVGKKELAMAEMLIDSMTDEWDPGKYKDEYVAGMMKVIEEKIKAGGKDLPAPRGVSKAPSNVVDLVAILQQSLNKSSKPIKGKKPSSKAEKKHRKVA
jgi:DNA end-binding protein Ku